MLLRDAFERHYRPRNLRSASKATLSLWGVALRHVDKFLQRPATTDDLTDNVICQFATWRSLSVQPATVNRDLASILALWRYLHRRGIVDRWPDVPLENEPIRAPLAWTQDEFGLILRTARTTPGYIGASLANRWWPALLLTCFDSGERIGAVLGLEWSDVNIASRWCVFRAEVRKGRDRDNVVRLAPDTVLAIQQMAKESAHVFHWPWTRTYLWKRYGQILERAGLPNDRRRKFHAVRRTVASHFEAAGGNATELLRHASRKNTLAYLDPRILKPQQATDLLWRPGQDSA